MGSETCRNTDTSVKVILSVMKSVFTTAVVIRSMILLLSSMSWLWQSDDVIVEIQLRGYSLSPFLACFVFLFFFYFMKIQPNSTWQDEPGAGWRSGLSAIRTLQSNQHTKKRPRFNQVPDRTLSHEPVYQSHIEKSHSIQWEKKSVLS